MYSLFIDDERFPPEQTQKGDWVIARTQDEVKKIISERGFPDFISFDHDLGDEQPTGYDIAKYLVELDMDNAVIPDNFSFYVHSQNPIGAKNIQSYLDSYLRIKEI